MRVLFVDDEAIIREGLHSLIDWQKAGFIECLDAPNAIDAIEMIEKNPPDLIITDIFMPEMSGIEFAKRIKQSHPGIRFIILTGYEKFEYAKEAVSLGISSYLVKPVLPEELQETVNAVVKEITYEQRNSLQNEDTRRKLDIYKPIIIEKLWADLMSGTFQTPEEMEERMEAAGLYLEEGSYYCIAIKININQVVPSGADIAQLKGKVRAIAEKKLKRRWMHFADSGPGLIQVILHKQVEPDVYEALLAEIEGHLKVTASIGVGRSYDSYSFIPHSVHEAEEAVHLLSLLDHRGIIHYEDMPNWNKSHVEYPYAEEKELIETVRFRDQFEVYPLRPFIAALEQQKAISPMMKLMFVHLLGTVYRLADEYQAGDTMPSYFESYTKLNDMESVQDIEYFFEDCFNQLLVLRTRTNAGFVDVLVERAKLAMTESYADSELSVSTVAKLLCITPNYLSRIFHQKTGMTCVEFLTGIRLEEAKKLLVHTSLRNYDIAEKIGYASAHYFSSLFKKNTGFTPSDFRDRYGARES
ncbi:response regulator [Paenibacillus sp. GCM10012307]|uniref:Response regulator n=1 Tax=Paenibacillus roseus TaxID=2798579 RepID=A0A934J928_9BACL|nr:response regulator [Paenibacillus roseus]MBJ6362677.1 response regulator [Paenibacillus roseus]